MNARALSQLLEKLPSNQPMLSYIALSKLITQHHPAVGALEFAAKAS